MAGGLVRSVGYGGTTDAGNRVTPLAKRTNFVLSDGTRLVVIADFNQSGVSGDGGDGSNIVKFYIYTSPDGTTWTLKATITPTTTFQPLFPNGVHWGATVGANNNVHVFWGQPGGAIQYRRADYSAGPTYTLQPEETVAAAVANTEYRRFDADVATGNIVVLGCSSRYIGGASSTWHAGMRLYVRNASNVWVAQPYAQTFSTGQTVYPGGDDFTLACDRAGPVSNEINIMCMTVRKRNSDAADLGDVLWRFRVNTSTGAAVSNAIITPSSITQTGFSQGYNTAYRRYVLYGSANNEWTVVGLVGRVPVTQFAWRFTYVGSTFTELIPRRYNTLPNSRFDYNDVWNWTSISYGNESGGTHGMVSGRAKVATMSFHRTPAHSVEMAGHLQNWDGTYNFTGPGAYGTVGDTGNVNLSYNKHGTLWFAGAPAYRIEYLENKVPLGPSGVTPATGATVTTDRPVLTADFKLSINEPQTRHRMEWQLATDAGFTTNLRTVTESRADFLLPYNTAPGGLAKVSTQEQVDAAAEMFQATWYVRARSLTFLNDVGAWSAGQSFNVTHPPTAGNLFPAGDITFKYGVSGAVSFSWQFSDPSPYDFQTAYQIVVEKVTDGTVVLDTGKIVSTAFTGTHNIPVGGKDFQLRWKIRVWDSDDVVGSYTSGETFYTVDDPTVAITFPVDAAVISTGNPTVTWTTTVGGSRTQTHYRVLLYSAGILLYDSGWQLSSLGLHAIPVGYISNLTAYSVQVTVRDNLGLEASDTNAFSTLYTLPAAPSPVLNTANYGTLGYNRITWTNAVEDVDFIGWLVYRRVAGTEEWTLLDTFSTSSPTYTYDDYLAGSGVEYDYSVTQLVDRFSSIVESAHAIVTGTGISEYYWLLHPTDSSKHMMLRNVTDDPHTDEYESSTINLIGRGRHTEYGDHLGISGTLTVQLRDNELATARALKLQILALKGEKGYLYLRTPFGDVYTVSLGNIGITRVAGVGRAEYVDLDIPYQEEAV